MNLLKISKQIIVRHISKKTLFLIQSQTFYSRFILSQNLHGNENLAKYEMKFYSISTRLPLIIYIKMILYCYKEIKVYVFFLKISETFFIYFYHFFILFTLVILFIFSLFIFIYFIFGALIRLYLCTGLFLAF